MLFQWIEAARRVCRGGKGKPREEGMSLREPWPFHTDTDVLTTLYLQLDLVLPWTHKKSSGSRRKFSELWAVSGVTRQSLGRGRQWASPRSEEDGILSCVSQPRVNEGVLCIADNMGHLHHYGLSQVNLSESLNLLHPLRHPQTL